MSAAMPDKDGARADSPQPSAGESSPLSKTGKKSASVFRSSKVYLPLLTSLALIVLFSLYFLLYVSSQEAYYNGRAFRVLATLGGKLDEKISIVRIVLTASTYYDGNKATDYIRNHLRPFRTQRPMLFRKDPRQESKRDGQFRLVRLDGGEGMLFRVQYGEGDPSHLAKGEQFCSAYTLAACADVDFGPAIRPLFERLNEKFFDDILIADSTGRILYQHSANGPRVTNLAAITASTSAAATRKTSAEDQPQKDEKGSGSSGARRSRFSEISEFSNLIDVKLAGGSYKLYLHPLPVMFQGPQRTGEADQSSLVICGLRSAAHVRAEMVALPYTHLIWGSVVLLAAMLLIWPVLKISYMSSRERLRHKHVISLALSILLATALLTLTALNISYNLQNDAASSEHLKHLAQGIKSGISGELTNALDALDAVSNSRYLLEQMKSNKWDPQSGFLAKFLTDGNLFDAKEKEAIQSYPFFHYMFWVDERGTQKFKLGVEDQATPPVTIAGEHYFDDVLHDNLTTTAEKKHRFRLQYLHSPNTGELFAVLAKRFRREDGMLAGPSGLAASILVSRIESLVDAVVPAGYGYAVVNRNGLVQFHSVSTRNQIEDFVEECRTDTALLALLASGSEDWLDVNYMGRRQMLFVTPLRSAGLPELTLITFRDTNYFNTLNVMTILVFALIFVLYAIPFVILTVTHVVRRRDYPLQAIWPCPSRTGDYIQVLGANLFLLAAFFIAYGSLDTADTMRATIALGFVGCLVAIQHMLGGWFEVFGHALVFTMLVALTAHSIPLLLLFTSGFLLYHARAAVIQRRAKQSIPLRYLYTGVTLSILMTVVVAPCCGFFKVAYESIHRLSLQREQLLLARKLAERRERIHRYYDFDLNLQRKDIAERRLKWTYDRHDYGCLNVDPASIQPGDLTSLNTGWFQKVVARVGGVFPSNPMGADLRELALTAPAGLQWVLTPPAKGRATYLALRSVNEGTVSEAEVLSAYPTWMGLNGWGIVALAGSAAILAAWILVGTKKVFLVDLEDAPRYEEADKDAYPRPGRMLHLLIVGHPKSGKSSYAKRIPGIQLVDIGKLAATDDWTLQRPLPRVVGIDRFEFDIDNPQTNLKKLHLLEELIYAENCSVVILSSIDPMYYLAAECPSNVVESGDLRTAMQLLDRWATVLTPFHKIRVDDITVPKFKRLCGKLAGTRDAGFQRFVDFINEECNHTAQLRNIGAAILRKYQRRSLFGVTDSKLTEEVLNRAETYYRVLWSNCTKEERLVLFQLAQDGWANPNNERALRQLERRNIIRRSSGFRIMNESFRRCIQNAQYPEEIAEWEQDEKQSLWKALKLSMITAGVLVAGWLLYAQQEILNLSLGYMSAFAAAGGIIIKLLSDFRGRSAGPAASK